MPTGYTADQQNQPRDAPRVGDVVERDIDGIWFPAKVLAVHERRHSIGSSDSCSNARQSRQLAFDLVYLDDQNRESEVPEGDLRVVYDYGSRTKDELRLHIREEERFKGSGSREPRLGGGWGSDGGRLEGHKEKTEAAAETVFHGEGEEKEKSVHYDGNGRDSDLDPDDSLEHEGPKVTIHTSHGTFDTKEDGSATAYIINGPETNVAAGSGLRGIRWLRGP